MLARPFVHKDVSNIYTLIRTYVTTYVGPTLRIYVEGAKITFLLFPFISTIFMREYVFK